MVRKLGDDQEPSFEPVKHGNPNQPLTIPAPVERPGGAGRVAPSEGIQIGETGIQLPSNGQTDTCSHASTSEISKFGPKDYDWIPLFLSALTEGMSVGDAARAAGIHYTLAFRRRKTDKAFDAAWMEATKISTKLLEREAARRAYHGVERPVYHKGIECGRIRHYSDVLMIFLLKARKPEMYRDQHEQGMGGTNVQVNVQANIAAQQVIRDMIEKGELGLLDTSTDTPSTGAMPIGAAPMEVVATDDASMEDMSTNDALMEALQTDDTPASDTSTSGASIDDPST